MLLLATAVILHTDLGDRWLSLVLNIQEREKRRTKTQAIKQGMMPELLTETTRIIDN